MAAARVQANSCPPRVDTEAADPTTVHGSNPSKAIVTSASSSARHRRVVLKATDYIRYPSQGCHKTPSMKRLDRSPQIWTVS